MSSRIDTYLQYGVPSDKANLAIAKGVSASTFRSVPKKDLISKYGFNAEDVDFIKNCLKRNPIDENTLNALLERSNYLCCICKGTKSDAYIIHHIEEYSKSQDNSYDNLAVLCPNDHDLAHREGIQLTQRVLPENIRKSKANWEKTVENENVRKASLNGEVDNVDYVNIPRILETCREIIGEIPDTKYTESLVQKGLIHNDGNINMDKLGELGVDINKPLNFFGPLGSSELGAYFFELVKKIVDKVNFVDLDDLLNKTELNKGLVGRYCYYVGGLYGKNPEYPITEDTPDTHIYLRRKPFFVEWKVNPHYLTSTTATNRLANRTVYLVYGRIRSVGNIEWKGEKFIHVDVRTFAFGIPIVRKDRTPLVHYEKQWDGYFDEEE